MILTLLLLCLFEQLFATGADFARHCDSLPVTACNDGSWTTIWFGAPSAGAPMGSAGAAQVEPEVLVMDVEDDEVHAPVAAGTAAAAGADEAGDGGDEAGDGGAAGAAGMDFPRATPQSAYKQGKQMFENICKCCSFLSNV